MKEEEGRKRYSVMEASCTGKDRYRKRIKSLMSKVHVVKTEVFFCLFFTPIPRAYPKFRRFGGVARIVIIILKLHGDAKSRQLL